MQEKSVELSVYQVRYDYEQRKEKVVPITDLYSKRSKFFESNFLSLCCFTSMDSHHDTICLRNKIIEKATEFKTFFGNYNGNKVFSCPLSLVYK